MIKGTDNIHDAIEKVAGLRRVQRLARKLLKNPTPEVRAAAERAFNKLRQRMEKFPHGDPMVGWMQRQGLNPNKPPPGTSSWAELFRTPGVPRSEAILHAKPDRIKLPYAHQPTAAERKAWREAGK